MSRRNRSNVRTPQRRKGFPVRVERILNQLTDDAYAAILYMGRDGR